MLMTEPVLLFSSWYCTSFLLQVSRVMSSLIDIAASHFLIASGNNGLSVTLQWFTMGAFITGSFIRTGERVKRVRLYHYHCLRSWPESDIHQVSSLCFKLLNCGNSVYILYFMHHLVNSVWLIAHFNVIRISFFVAKSYWINEEPFCLKCELRSSYLVCIFLDD